MKTARALIIIVALFFLGPLARGATPDSNILKLSSSLWGELRDMKFDGTTGYCVFFDGLATLDLTNINSPSQMGQVELSTGGQRVDVSGNYAYVASADSLLYVVDIASLIKPSLIDSFKLFDKAMDIKVRDDFAFVAAGQNGLLILDIFDPQNVAVVGSCSVSNLDAQSLYLLDDFAYLTGGATGVKVIDVSSPESPFLAGSYDSLGGVKRVFVNEDDEKRIYACLGTSWEFRILDVTNPVDIFTVSSCVTESDLADLFVKDDCAYLALTTDGILVLDIRDKESPTPVSASSCGDFSKGIFVHSDFVFVSDLFGPTSIVNVFNPDRPFSAGTYRVPRFSTDVFVEDNLAYVLCENTGFYILDVEDPSDPQTVSVFDAQYNNNGVCAEGDFVYFSALVAGMRVVDVSDPSHPQAVSVYHPEGYSYGVQVRDGFAYFLNSENDIQIIDVHDPYNPAPKGFIETPGTLKDITISGDYLYAADLEMGLTIIDISDKDDLFVVTSIPTVGRCTNVFSNGNLLLIAAQHVGLEIYNITDPTAPSFLGCYFTDEGIEDVYAENQYAYFSTTTDCVRVIDLNSPSSSLLVGTYHSRDNPGKLVVKEERIYLCDGRSFKILEFDPPTPKSENEFLQYPAHPFQLEQNYPNPFNPSTDIRFAVYGSRFMVHRPLPTTLTIYNVLGKKVRTLVDEERMPGDYQVNWDGKNEMNEEVAGGVYFCRLKVGDFEQTKKMILMR